MNRAEIELKARELQTDIWRNRKDLFPLGVPGLLDMFEPSVAAHMLGYSYDVSGDLGRWGQGRDRFEIAGSLDRQRKIIAVSTKFKYPAMRFTGAHEIGHIVLGHSGRTLHRDRPVFEMDERYRDPIEREADYFAACFLAPEKLVRDAYKERFPLGPPLPLTDAVAFQLCGTSGHALSAIGTASLDFAAAVASARSFNGLHFMSMADQFGISVGAMAIRISELKLIKE